MALLKISKAEKIFLFKISIIILILLILPFGFGKLMAGQEFYYTGLNPILPYDNFVYYSYLEQIKNGHFLLKDLFTGELPETKIFNPFWLLMGFLSRVLKIPSDLMYFFSKLILIPIFLLVLYKITIYFIDTNDIKIKKISFIYLIFASGLGFYFSNFFKSSQDLIRTYDLLPMDLWNPEANIFLSFFGSPHIVTGWLFLILSIYFLYQSIEEDNFKKAIVSGFCALFLLSFHPFHFLTLYAVFLIYLFVLKVENKTNQKHFLKFFLMIIISSPAVIYYFLLQVANWQFQLKALQNTTFSPSFFIILISYGLILIMALITTVEIWQRKVIKQRHLFLTIWLISGLFLIYSPVNFQRRLILGIFLPLAILSFIFGQRVYEFLKQRIKVKGFLNLSLIIFFIILFLPPNFFLYLNNFKFLHYFRFLDDQKNIAVFLKKEEAQALKWYEQNSMESDIILASYYSGNFIPAYTARKVYLGHGIETLNYFEKKGLATWFFMVNNEDKQKKEFLKQNKITYLYFSSREKTLGNFKPSEKDYLEKIFQLGQSEIYKVNLE